MNAFKGYAKNTEEVSRVNKFVRHFSKAVDAKQTFTEKERRTTQLVVAKIALDTKPDQ